MVFAAWLGQPRHVQARNKRPHNCYFCYFAILGGAWLGLYGPSGHCVGPHGCSSTRIVTKLVPKLIPGATEGFPKKSNFGNLAGVTKQP